MDFKDFVVNADTPVFFQARHPVTDEPLTDGELPVGAWLYGRDSKVVKQREKAMQQKVTEAAISIALEKQNKGKGKVSSQSSDAIVDINATLKACVHKLDRIAIDGVEMTTSEAHLDIVWAKLPWLVEQWDIHAGDRSNFMGTVRES